jgi:hypothetical protein
MDCVKVDMGNWQSWELTSRPCGLGNMELTIQQCETWQFSEAKLMKSSWNQIAKYSSSNVDFSKLGLEESMK